MLAHNSLLCSTTGDINSMPRLEDFIFTHENMKLHNGPAGTFEVPARLGAKYSNNSIVEPRLIYEETIFKVHTADYIRDLNDRCKRVGKDKWGCTTCSFINDITCKLCEMCGSLQPYVPWEYLGMIDGDTTYINQHSIKAVYMAVTCACDLSTGIVTGKIPFGFALVRPPGHHASKDTGKGFCLLNNTAIAAEAALEVGASRVFIFDWDLHHGDGIQDHFYNRSDVFYCSMHADGIYPHSGKVEEIGVDDGYGFTLNIPLPKGTTDEDYLNQFTEHVLPAINRFSPDIILIAAGFDGLATDPINIFKLTPYIFSQMIHTMKSINSKIGLILEGGYDVNGIQTCVDLCIESLLH